MDIIDLKRKTEEMLGRLKENDILSYFPHIVYDLEFYVFEYPKLIDSYSETDIEENIVDLQVTRIEYFAYVLSEYMKLIWNRNFEYEIDPVGVTASGGYSYTKDRATFAVLGLLLNSCNTCDDLKVIFHEFRHALQNNFLKETNIEKILEYPSNFIVVAKNYVPAELEILTAHDYEMLYYTGGRQYYLDNYKRVYSEIDANYYGLEESKKFLYRLYELSPNKSKELEETVLKIIERLREEEKVARKILIDEGKFENIYVEEIRTNVPITSKVLFNYSEEDGLLFPDKVLRTHIDKIDKIPVFKILLDDDRFKTYPEILEDQNRLGQIYDKSKVDRLYGQIVRTSPMLLIGKYIVENDVDRVYKFLEAHPTFVDEYQEEIRELLNTLETPSSIKNLLLRKSYQKKKNYGIIM